MENKEYTKTVKKMQPDTHAILNVTKAFIVGGLICIVAQFFYEFIVSKGADPIDSYGYTTTVMIFLGTLLTGLGIYDKLGQFAGAGSIVPVTGFANSVVSPSIEFKKEGYILGTAAKMFNIAGPVLVYGFNTAVLVGLIYYVIQLF